MSRGAATLRAFSKPRIWVVLWVLMIVAVIVLSLMPKPPIPPTLMIGKLDHLIAYAALAAMAVQLYAARRTQLVAALALVALGVALELAQGYLTSYRHMAAYDALVDALGIALGLATTRTRLATALLRIDTRF
jgi:VanZ family protein